MVSAKLAGGPDSARGGPMPFVGWVLLAAALGLHLWVVLSIAAQPLDVSSGPAAARSVIWPLHYDTIHRAGPGADFYAIYHAGRSLDTGQDPYAPEEEPSLTPDFYPFRYLPAVAGTLGVAMAELPPQVAYRLWLLILEIGLGLLLLVLARQFREWRLRCFIVCVLLLSGPYFLELHMGQFTFITSTLLCLALLAVAAPATVNPVHVESGRRCWWRWGQPAGMLSYAAASLLKVFPLVTIPALVRHRRFWPSLALAVVAVLATSVPYFIAHPAAWQTFYQENLSNEGGMGAGNYGLVYLIHLAATDLRLEAVLREWPGAVTAFRLLILSVTTGLVLLGRRNDAIAGSAALVLAYFLTYTHVWEHHMSGAMVVGALLLTSVAAQAHGPRRRTLLVLTGASLVLLALPTPFVFLDAAKDPEVFDPSYDWPAYARYLLVLPKVLPVLTLYSVSVAMLGQAGFAVPWKSVGPPQVPRTAGAH